MKWVKVRYCDKANTHRAGWKFWDLIDDDNESVAYVRYRPDYGYNLWIDELTEGPQWAYYRHALFPTLKEAQGHCVAYFIAKKLED